VGLNAALAKVHLSGADQRRSAPAANTFPHCECAHPELGSAAAIGAPSNAAIMASSMAFTGDGQCQFGDASGSHGKHDKSSICERR
jgi:hypothetical protein